MGLIPPHHHHHHKKCLNQTLHWDDTVYVYKTTARDALLYYIHSDKLLRMCRRHHQLSFRFLKTSILFLENPFWILNTVPCFFPFIFTTLPQGISRHLRFDRYTVKRQRRFTRLALTFSYIGIIAGKGIQYIYILYYIHR